MKKNTQIRLSLHDELHHVVALAHELADAAAAEILPLFRASVAQNKSSGKGARAYDPVTEADKRAEAAMRALIKARFPAHGVLGEEFASHQVDADYLWVLDPIDGTRGFLAGMPSWGTLIGLLYKGEPVFGLMNQPFVGERFYGDGDAAFRRDRDGVETRLGAAGPAKLDEALLACTTPDMFSRDESRAFAALHDAVRDTRYGTDCYGYCLLAAGSVNLICEADLKPFDILPLVPILAGAGAVVSTWDGGEVSKGGRIVAAANETLHAAALGVLQNAAQH